ncbi:MULTISPECIES: TRAP transporter large permease [Pseudomonadota]
MNAAGVSSPQHDSLLHWQPVTQINGLLVKLTGIAAAVILAAEAVILLAGVISRYVFNMPLSWSDELAGTLFIWLSMLGAVLALDRGEHMRLTALVNKMSPRWQSRLETVTALLVCVVTSLIILPAMQHAGEEMAITTPALGLPAGLRAAALPVGAGLMMLTSIAAIMKRSRVWDLLGAVVVLGALATVFYFLQSTFWDMGNYALLVFFVGLLGFAVALGLPIAFAFGLATIAYLGLATDTPYMVVVSRIDEGMSHAILLSVPLFVLLGALLALSGMADALINFMGSLLGHVRGGLQFVLLGAMFLVSGISGSKVADMAAVAPALFPEMKKRGHKPEELVALLNCTGAMTETIPPSIVLITIGAVCGVSITALFTGGLMPAVIATLAIAVVCWFEARKDPSTTAPKASRAVVLRTFIVAIPALFLPLLIRYAVVMGMATATEVATIGTAYVMFIWAITSARKGGIKLSVVYPMLVETAALSGAILLTIGTATAMSWALTQSGFSLDVVDAMMEVPGGSIGFMLITIIAFVILGSILEGIPAIVLFGPLLFPIAIEMGINDVHYAMVVILSMGIGMFAPPFGVGFYAACSVGKVSPDLVFNRVWRYLTVLFVALLAVAFIPWISTGFL